MDFEEKVERDDGLVLKALGTKEVGDGVQYHLVLYDGKKMKKCTQKFVSSEIKDKCVSMFLKKVHGWDEGIQWVKTGHGGIIFGAIVFTAMMVYAFYMIFFK